MCKTLATALTRELANMYSAEGDLVCEILPSWGEGKEDWQVLVYTLMHDFGEVEIQKRDRLWVIVARPDYVSLGVDAMQHQQRSRTSSFGGLLDRAKAGKNVATGMWRMFKDPPPVLPWVRGKAVLMESPSEKTPAIARTVPFSSADDPGAFDMIRTWISDCRSSHGKLCNEYVDTEMPKRYIDVNLDGDLSFIRLVESKDSESWKIGRYVALSYSWGRPPFVTTTLENIQQHKVGIRVSGLPRTIQDAVKTTRELGIPLLWIDSLCILQGPASDMEVVGDQDEQLPQMGLVYTNAFITIIAGNTNSVNDSFLASRTGVQAQCILLDRSFYDTDHVPVWHSPGAKVLPGYDLDRESWMSTSDTRGWCLQEKVLAKRIILYQDEGIVYSCRTTWRSEVDRVRGKLYVVDKDSLAWHLNSRQSKKWFWAGVQLSGGAGDWFTDPGVEWKYALWTWLIQQYTSRNLTDSDDKLRAVAGIADVWQRVFNDEYCAGMWKTMLHHQLLWVHSGKRADRSRKYEVSRAYRAPSWSWANVEGSIHFHFGLVNGVQRVPTGTSVLAERAPKFVHRTIPPLRVQSFDMKLADDGYVEPQAFMESTRVQDLGPHILGYLKLQGAMREARQPIGSSIPVEAGRDVENHWSGTFFDSGEQHAGITFYYLEILRFGLTYPKSSPVFDGRARYGGGKFQLSERPPYNHIASHNAPAKMQLSSGLVLERLEDDAEPGPATLSRAEHGFRVEHDGPRYRRIGVFWALPSSEIWQDSAYVTAIVL